MNNSTCQVGSISKTPFLVVDNGGINTFISKTLHRLNEVLSIANNPAGPNQVVLGSGDNCCIATSFRLTIHAERAWILGLRVKLRRTIEDVFGRNMHHRQVVFACDSREIRRSMGIGSPSKRASFRCFCSVDVCPRCRIDNDVVLRPVERVHGGIVSNIKFWKIDTRHVVPSFGELLEEFASKLTICSGYQNTSRIWGRERNNICEFGMSFVLIGQNRVLQRNWPINCDSFIVEVQEGVFCVGRPVVIHQIGVCSIWF